MKMKERKLEVTRVNVHVRISRIILQSKRGNQCKILLKCADYVMLGISLGVRKYDNLQV
jgi:hypothetical protein